MVVEQPPNVWTYGCGTTSSRMERTEQHTKFTYQTSNTQFIDAPEDGPVGLKHVELSNILGINIQPQQKMCILLDYICNLNKSFLLTQFFKVTGDTNYESEQQN